MQDITSGVISAGNIKVSVSNDISTIVGYTNVQGHVIFKSSLSFFFDVGTSLTIVSTDLTGLLR